MSLPSYQEFYPYILKVLEDRKTYSLKNIREKVSISMNVTKEQMKELLPSKKQTIFNNRV